MPIWKKNQEILFYFSQSTLKYGSENRPWMRGLTSSVKNMHGKIQRYISFGFAQAVNRHGEGPLSDIVVSQTLESGRRIREAAKKFLKYFLVFGPLSEGGGLRPDH